MRVGILGMGEVGKALYYYYKKKNIKVFGKDIKDSSEFKKISVLNICIPYSNDFFKIVCNEIIKTKPKLTIIHSTVPIGTTKSIKNNSNFPVAHSPVVGSHPYLYKSLKTFIKYAGCDDTITKKLVKRHFKKIKINYILSDSSESTELAKLLCTSYYGLCIAWHDYISKACKKYNVDFSFIKNWNINYNLGYKHNKGKKYNRPILDPPLNNKIGGHCVIPNAEILQNQIPSDFLKEILRFK